MDCSSSICEADVILMQRLDEDVKKYTLNLEVKDTRGERTVVETEIMPKKSLGAFLGYVVSGCLFVFFISQGAKPSHSFTP